MYMYAADLPRTRTNLPTNSFSGHHSGSCHGCTVRARENRVHLTYLCPVKGRFYDDVWRPTLVNDWTE